jgi:hypothetical protein
LNNYFSQLLNVHNVSDVRQTEVYIAEPLVPSPSRLEVEIAIAKFKKYKSPGSDQIPAELIQAGGEILPSAIHSVGFDVTDQLLIRFSAFVRRENGSTTIQYISCS